MFSSPVVRTKHNEVGVWDKYCWSHCVLSCKKTFIGNQLKIVVYLNHTFSFIANIFFVFFGSNKGWFFEFSQVSGVVPMIWQYWIENGQNNTYSHLVTLEDRHTVDRLTEIPKSECWVFAACHHQPLNTVHIYFLLAPQSEGGALKNNMLRMVKYAIWTWLKSLGLLSFDPHPPTA